MVIIDEGKDERLTSSATVPPVATAFRSERVHFLDNLRTVTTALLICHHACMHFFLDNPETENTPPSVKSAQLPLALFITTNKSFIFEVFFLISGYSARLGLESKTDVDFLGARLLKRVLPAYAWDNIVRRVGRKTILSLSGRVAFCGKSDRIFDGPGKYVYSLIWLDFAYLAARFIGRNTPALSPMYFESKIKDSRTHASLTLAGAFTIVLACAVGSNYPPQHVRAHLADVFRAEGDSGVPGSYVIAYLAGANLPLLLEILLPTRTLPAAVLLAGSLAAAHAALRGAHALWPALWAHTRPARGPAPFQAHVAPHKTFLAPWSALVGVCVPLALAALFASAPMLRRRWRADAHTYVQTFVHMAPIVVAARVLEAVGMGGAGRPLTTAAFTGTAGVGVSMWTARVVMLLKRRYVEYIPQAEITIRFPGRTLDHV